jgi:hypothetical protein
MKIFCLVILVSAIISGMTGCTKSSTQGVNTSAITADLNNSNNSLKLAVVYNDTLKMVYDVATIRKNNPTCIKYDKLYHKNDSVFSINYHMFGDEMYRDGIMMNSYTPGTMMGGMGSGGMMDRQVIIGDTAMMNGYYRSMQQLHTVHLVYHNGIYN